jgi:hypothetical protein
MLKKLYTKSKTIIAAAVVAAFIISISYAQTSLESIRTLVFSWRIREAGKAMAEINNIPPGLRALYDFYDGNYSDAYDRRKVTPNFII